MPLPPPRKLNTPDVPFSRAQDNTAETLRILASKQYLISGETALFLTTTVTVPSDRVAVTFQGAWANYDANHTVTVTKDATGWVSVDGLARTGVIGTYIFNWPSSAYAPSQELVFAGISNNGGVYAAATDVRADTTGVLAAAGTSVTWFSVSNVRFRAANRAPIAPSCWPVQLPCPLPARPTAVLLASAVETGSGARVAAANPDWSWETQQGVNFVIINNVPLLPPSATYDLTFLVTGEQ